MTSKESFTPSIIEGEKDSVIISKKGDEPMLFAKKQSQSLKVVHAKKNTLPKGVIRKADGRFARAKRILVLGPVHMSALRVKTTNNRLLPPGTYRRENGRYAKRKDNDFF